MVLTLQFVKFFNNFFIPPQYFGLTYWEFHFNHLSLFKQKRYGSG
jgi:hypothetical protein